MKYTLDFKLALRYDYESGLNVKETALKNNLSVMATYHMLVSVGTSLRAPRTKYTKIDLERAQLLYDQLGDKSKVAKEMGIPKTSFRRHYTDKLVKNFSGSKYLKSEKAFFVIDTEEDAYYLGLIAADGSITPKGFRICLESKDRYILEGLRDYICADIPIKDKNIDRDYLGYKWTSNISTLTVSSMFIRNSLIAKGVLPNKSYEGLSIQGVPNYLLRHYIRGFFDGDGSVHYLKPNRCAVSFTSNDDSYLRSIREILIDSGIGKSPSKLGKAPYHLVYTAKADIAFLYDYFYRNSSVYMIRKYNKFQNYLTQIGVLGSDS
jgi:hypothetical protein